MLADDKSKLAEDAALFQQRKKAYIDANEQWKKRLPEGKLKTLIAVDAYEGGLRYIDIVESQMVPALRRGDHKAAVEARNRSVAAVEKCINSTNEAVELVRASRAELEQSAKREVSSSLFGLG